MLFLMRFHPVVSIFLGFIVFFILAIISPNFISKPPISLIICLIGGFVATYLSKKRKIRYGIYLGIIIALTYISIGILIAHATNEIIDYSFTLFYGVLFIIFGGFLGKITEKNNRLAFKQQMNKTRFNPLFSICLGILVFLVLFYMPIFVFSGSPLATDILGYASILMGSFVATHFSTNRKIEYGIFIGIPLIIFYITFKLNSPSHYIIVIINILLFTFIGSFLGKTDKDLLYNGVNPILAILLGVAFAGAFNTILGVTLNLQNTYHSFEVMNFLIGIIAIMTGAAITTFLAKEKKLQYGIYIAIIFITYWILEVITHITLPGTNSLLIHLGVNIGYLLSGIAGGYLGVKTSEHLNKKLN